jgi:phage shock protein PspC (stress-responsive transcriptional regulator)
MNMDPKFVRRRRIVAVIVGALVLGLFTYAIGDVCWTKSGYGSCSQMIEEEVNRGR